MCKWCEDPEGPMYCPDCTRLICLEVKAGDDFLRAAYITEGGDVFCDLCGPGYDGQDDFGGLLDEYYETGYYLEMDLGGEEE